MGELIMLLFHARTAAHVMHLRTRSYAAHKALNEFYDGLVGLADSLAESYQGRYELITDFKAPVPSMTEPLELMDMLRKYIATHRYTAAKREDTELQNMIDEIVSLIDSTTYKLKFLR